MNNKGIKHIVLFFIVTFVFSWALWIFSILDNQGAAMPGILLLLSNFAIIGPMIAAMIVLRKTEGKGAIKGLFKNAWNWKFDKKWLLYTLIIPFSLTAIAFFLKHIIAGSDVVFDLLMPLPILIVFILVAGGPIEEFGWRGYALPKLLKKTSPFIATLVLGFVWSLWHLPLHFMANTVQSNIPIFEFFLVTIEAAFIYTWIYKKTNGSLVPMIALHWFSNLASAIFLYYDTSYGRYIFFGLQLVLIVYLVLKEKTMWFKMAKKGI